jgi:hypothetical protein
MEISSEEEKKIIGYEKDGPQVGTRLFMEKLRIKIDLELFFN